MSHDHLPWIVTPDGQVRPLGNRPGTPLAMAGMAAVPMVPQSDWVEFDLRENSDFPIKIKDQNGYGACNGHATATSLEAARYVAGMTHVPLSAWFVYAQLCGGVDRGSSIEDSLVFVKDKGVAPESDVPYGIINPGRLNQASYQSAQRFKVEVDAPMTTFAELMSATQLRRPFNWSADASNWGSVDSEGVVGGGGGVGNHALAGGFGAKRLKSGTWAILYPNSWGTRWGQDGWAYFTERHVRGERYFASYCISAVADDPSDPTNPPILIA